MRFADSDDVVSATAVLGADEEEARLVFLMRFADGSALFMDAAKLSFGRVPTLKTVSRIAPGTVLRARENKRSASVDAALELLAVDVERVLATAPNALTPMYVTSTGCSSSLVQAMRYASKLPALYRETGLLNTSAMGRFVACMTPRKTTKPPTTWVLLTNKWSYGTKWLLARAYGSHLQQKGVKHANKHFAEFLSARKYHSLLPSNAATAVPASACETVPKRVVVIDEPAVKHRVEEKSASKMGEDHHSSTAVAERFLEDVPSSDLGAFQNSGMVLHYTDSRDAAVCPFGYGDQTVTFMGQIVGSFGEARPGQAPVAFLRTDEPKRRFDFCNPRRSDFFDDPVDGDTFHEVEWTDTFPLDGSETLLLCRRDGSRALVATGAETVTDAHSWAAYVDKWMQYEREVSKTMQEQQQQHRGTAECGQQIGKPNGELDGRQNRKQTEFQQLYGSTLGFPMGTPPETAFAVANWSDLLTHCIKIRDALERLGWADRERSDPKGVWLPYCDFTHKRAVRLAELQRSLDTVDSSPVVLESACNDTQLVAGLHASSLPALRIFSDRLHLVTLEPALRIFTVHRDAAPVVRCLLEYLVQSGEPSERVALMQPYVGALKELCGRYFGKCTIESMGRDGESIVVRCEEPRQRAKRTLEKLCCVHQRQQGDAVFECRHNTRHAHPAFRSDVQLRIKLRASEDALGVVQRILGGPLRSAADAATAEDSEAEISGRSEESGGEDPDQDGASPLENDAAEAKDAPGADAPPEHNEEEQEDALDRVLESVVVSEDGKRPEDGRDGNATVSGQESRSSSSVMTFYS